MLKRGRSLGGGQLLRIDQFADVYVTVHEHILGARWIAENLRPAHPAHDRLAWAKRAGQMTYTHPEDEGQLPVIGRLFLDSYIWQYLGPHAGLDSPGAGRQGEIRLTDKKNQMITSRARNGAQYEDMMVELSTAAWYASMGWDVSAEEIPSGADFQASKPGDNTTALVECKHVRGQSLQQLDRIIRTANRQLRQGDCEGERIVHLHAGWLGPNRRMDLKYVPEEIQSMGNHIGRLVRPEKANSTDAIVITWDDWFQVMNRGTSELANIWFRRMPYIAYPSLDPRRPPPAWVESLPRDFGIEFQLARREEGR